MLKLYENIRKRREELGLSQQDLADLLNYKSRSTITKIESGENDIPQSKIVAFAKALQTTPANLMGWDIPTTHEIQSAIIENLKYYIETYNYSIDEIAKIADTNKTNVSRWLSGNKIPSTEEAKKLSEAFEISLTEFTTTIAKDDPKKQIQTILTDANVAALLGYDATLLNSKEINELTDEVIDMLKIMVKRYKK